MLAFVQLFRFGCSKMKHFAFKVVPQEVIATDNKIWRSERLPYFHGFICYGEGVWNQSALHIIILILAYFVNNYSQFNLKALTLRTISGLFVEGWRWWWRLRQLWRQHTVRQFQYYLDYHQHHYTPTPAHHRPAHTRSVLHTLWPSSGAPGVQGGTAAAGGDAQGEGYQGERSVGCLKVTLHLSQHVD